MLYLLDADNYIDLTVPNEERFAVGTDTPAPGQGKPLPNDPFVRWAIGPKNLYLNFSDPTILNLDKKQWNPDYVVIPKPFPEDSWIYLLIWGAAAGVPPSQRRTIPAAHPVSLLPTSILPLLFIALALDEK